MINSCHRELGGQTQLGGCWDGAVYHSLLPCTRHMMKKNETCALSQEKELWIKRAGTVWSYSWMWQSSHITSECCHRWVVTVKPPGAAAARFSSHSSLFKARELLVRKPAWSQLRRGQHVFWKLEQLHVGMSNHPHWEWNFSDPSCALWLSSKLWCLQHAAAACPAQKLLLIDPAHDWILDEADPQPEVL